MLLFLLINANLVIANAQTLPAEYLRKGRHKRLIGSDITTIHKHPYHVAIEVNGAYICGGAIISRKVVLTAAHCLIGMNNTSIKIRSGTSTVEKGGYVHDVLHRVLHRSFYLNKHTNSRFDIALAFVSPRFEIDDSHQVIDLYRHILSEDEELNDKATITGWGWVSPKGPVANDLQVLRLPLHSKCFCNDNYREFGGIYEGQICAGYIGVRNKDACTGDSGSPLVFDGKIIG